MSRQSDRPRTTTPMTLAAFALSLSAIPLVADAQVVRRPPIDVVRPPIDVIRPICFNPTLADCTSPEWQATTCGQQSLAAGTCDQMINDAVSSSPTSGGHWTMNDAGEYAWIEDLPAPATSSDYYYGWGDGYRGSLMQHATEIRNPGLANNPWVVSSRSKRAAWDANGERVESCEELAYEGWWTYSRFEDEVARRGSDARGIFESAKAVNLGAGPVLTRSGHRVLDSDMNMVNGLPFPSGRIPKNAYFLFAKTGLDRFPIPDEHVPSASGREAYAGDWAWHLQMDRHWGSAYDDVLDAEYARQKQFLKLLDRRAKLIDEIVADAAVLRPIRPVGDASRLLGATPTSAFATTAAQAQVLALPPSSVTRLTEAASPTSSRDGLTRIDLGYRFDHLELDTGGYTGKMGQLYVIDSRIAEHLEHAASMGCLDTSGPSVCDWSPRMFADLIRGVYVTEREEEYQRCMIMTGNDFGPSSAIRQPRAFEIPTLCTDCTTSAFLARLFIKSYDSYVNSLDFTPAPGSTTEPSWGWWRSGGETAGSPEWNANFDYTYGFGLVKSSGVGDDCVVNLKAQARAGANAVLKGKSFSILDADTWAQTVADDKLRVHSHMKLLGIYPVYDTFDRDYSGRGEPLGWKLTKEAAVSATFMIGFIPVTGEIGAVGTAGLDVDFGIEMNRTCTAQPTLDLKGAVTATPYVKADAFAGVLVGVKGFGAGIRSTLNVFDVRAPLTVSAQAYGTSRIGMADLINRLFLTINVDLGLTVDVLAGGVYGVLENPFKNLKAKFFEWEGKRLVNESWQKQWRIPVGRVIDRI